MIRVCGLLLLVLVAGCQANPPPPPLPAIPVSSRSIIDSLGRTVSLPGVPRRIVSLTPANTELLFALGCEDAIVGVSTSCNFPEAAKAKPQVASFVGPTNLEHILQAKPDLVLAGGLFQKVQIDALDRLGIPVAALDAGRLADVRVNLEKIGTLTGHKDRADHVAQTMQKELAAVSQRIARLPRKKVFYAVDEVPTTIGPKSFISELIAIAGGDNIFADATGDYPQVSREQVLLRKPDVVLYPKLGHDGRDANEKLLARLQQLSDAKIAAVDADAISRPGPRLVDAAKQLAEILHPSR